LEDRRLLSLVGVPPLGGLDWITAANDEPAAAGTPTEIAFSGEAGILTAAPATPDLLDISDTGISSTDNLTNLDNSQPTKTLQFSVGNTIVGATVTLYADGTAIGSAVADSATTTVTTNGSLDLGDGLRAITARQTAPGEEESTDSAALEVTIKTLPAVLGQWRAWGFVYDVTISGTRAYLAEGPTGLEIIDITNPAAPVPLGRYRSGGIANGVAVSGTRAYVADSDAGLVIVDVQNPAAPLRVGGYTGTRYAKGVAVSGTRVYVADEVAGLVILDASNPVMPKRLGQFNVSLRATSVVVSGTLAYVAEEGGGLQIIDVTNPAAPARVGRFDTRGMTTRDLTVSGTMAYLADYDAGVEILDVTNPAAPIWLGNYDTSSYAYGVAVSGTLLCVADGAGIVILDVTNPAAPVPVASYDTIGIASGTAICGTLAYVATGLGGLTIVDLGSPALAAPPDLQPASDTGANNGDNITGDNTLTFDIFLPHGEYFRVYRDDIQISGNWETGATYTTAVQLDGTYGYSCVILDAAGNASGMSPVVSVTIDTTIPSAPDLLAVSDTGVSDADNLTNLDNGRPDRRLLFAVGNAVAGATVALYADGILVGSAVADGTTTVVATNGRTGLADGGHAIMARQTLPGHADWIDSAATTVTIDTVGPLLNPALLGTYDTSGDANGVAVSGTRAYVADGYAGLQIIDVTNPAAPVRLGGYDTSGYAYGVSVSGTLAYVADGWDPFKIIDVSNPAKPIRLGGYDTPGSAQDVAVSGTRAYVADFNGGLAILDVSNPAALVRLGGYLADGLTFGVAVSGTLAYVAAHTAGLQILDVSQPATPLRLANYHTPFGQAYGVVVSGTRAYVAEGEAGLVILDVTDPTVPVRLGGYDTRGSARRVAIWESLVCVADDTAGLQIIDATNPAAPVLLATYDTSGAANGVTLSGTLAYVADQSSGLLIIDVIAPAAPPAPDLQAASDTGVSSTDNITSDNTPTFNVAVRTGAYFRIYREGVQISGDDEAGSSYTTAVQPDGTYEYTSAVADAAGNLSPQSAPRTVTIHTVRPTVIATTVNGGAAQRSRISSLAVRFSEDVSGSLGATDLTLVNRDSGAAVNVTGVTPTYDPATQTATWNLSGIAIEDGYYRATLQAAGVSDVAGNLLAGGNYPIDFFRLLGDTDGNAKVDIFDVAKVQVNYGQTSGMSPAEGDFDGNGTVDIFDVALLQVQYGKTLAPPAPMPAEAPAAVESERGHATFSPRDVRPRHDLDAEKSSVPVGERDLRGEKAEGPLLPAGMQGWTSHPWHPTGCTRRKSRFPAFPKPALTLAVHHAAENAAWESAVDRVLENDGETSELRV
jgi:hypothetical protein